MYTKQFKRRPLALAIAMAPVAGTALVGAAHAQNDLALEEVVVTAQKRESTILDTPISVTSLDNFQLEQINASSLVDLNGYVPALFSAPFAADSAAPVVFIRGMGNVDVQTTKDQAVGVYLDGVVLGRATGLALDIADLERVEVLRGPQGTLYGRNTTGGAINYVTRKPHDELSAKVRLSAGNYNYFGTQVDLNIPLTERFYIKGAYLKNKMDGWVDNENFNGLPDQVDPNEQDNDAWNFAFRGRPTDNFVIDYAFDYSHLDYGNGYYQVVQASAAPPGVLDLSAVTPTRDRQDEAQFPKGLSPSTVATQGHNLTLTWDVGPVTLKSISGYREMSGDLFQNYLEGLNYFSLDPVNNPPPASEFVQTNDVSQYQFSQELQAIGAAFDESVQYVVGLYYFRETSSESQVSNFGLPEGVPNGPFPVLDSWDIEAESESAAIYGQGTWRPNALAQKLGLTLGLRYTDDHRKATKTYYEILGMPINQTAEGDADFSNTSGNFTVDYLFTDNLNVYGRYATGYRAGGFSTRAKLEDFPDGFDPEEVQSFEVGLKSRLWDQRISLNAALYYNDYDDLQVANFEPPVFNQTINAGDATIKGGEVELIARLSRGWTLDAFYAYIDAEYGDYFSPNAAGEIVDQADVKKVPNAPRNQASGGIEYAFPVTSIGQFTLRADYLWVDEFWSNPDSTNQNDAYGLLNARVQWLGIPLPAGEIRLALWGKNLTDEEYTVLTTDFSGGDNNPSDVYRTLAAQYGMPRTYGLDFIYEY